MAKHVTELSTSESHSLLDESKNGSQCEDDARQTALPQKDAILEASKQQLEHGELSKMSSNGAKSAHEDNSDEYSVQFSAAQLKVKIAQAKHDTKLIADAEVLQLKKELVEQRYQVTDRERERDKAMRRCEALQMQLDAVLLEHKKTLLGMCEDVQLEKLLATIEMEKGSRQKLKEAFTRQQQTLTLAQERVEKLSVQVAQYQKTETVLAQSVAHLQYRFASKDQLRAATVEQEQRKLIDQHELEMKNLREELVIAQRNEKVAQDQLQLKQLELKTLHESKQQELASQERIQSLECKITQLETEKAVLLSKTEQIQKADAQLRSQIHAQSEEITTLHQEIETLQRSNKELGEIASDLLQVAERQHAENESRDFGETHAQDGIYLQKRKKRLRVSLG
ncbi:uncharacterized protein PHALS_09065 [Plasmopara halstedii]|uniref:Uncharacterized protein n=1 Tax=Plasmopara halstedii TaxID=4781 RepID=A0A0P1AED1_PLAHL|nr:uncharacterized protein PHALS_09065 [Plasmopara halstedii]CEG39000.1 hypothetical protein PHALS_09065 [Plasmopara halstedii]|eukprot:XP_024575369.1 hypothetical protein PHALS_09065 [Plasmopara halstedii]